MRNRIVAIVTTMLIAGGIGISTAGSANAAAPNPRKNHACSTYNRKGVWPNYTTYRLIYSDKVVCTYDVNSYVFGKRYHLGPTVLRRK
jgi:hypothetical protein